MGTPTPERARAAVRAALDRGPRAAYTLTGMNGRVLPQALFAIVACALLTGCPSFATLKTARALDPGQLQMTGAMEVLGMTAPTNKANPGLGGVRPTIIVAGRYGVAQGFDVGVRLEVVAGISADTTIQLVRSGPVDISLGPGAGYFQAPGPIAYGPRPIEVLATEPLYTIWSATVPLLVGFNFGQGNQVVLAPRVTTYFVQAGDGGGQWRQGGIETFLGGSLGVSLKLSPTLRVMPELDVTSPVGWTGKADVVCSPTLGNCSPFDYGAVIIQGGLSFTVGADNLGP